MSEENPSETAETVDATGEAAEPAAKSDVTGESATQKSANGIVARYTETDSERRVLFERDGQTAAIAQNIEGYAMLRVRQTAAGEELERYYGFDMAVDHAAELLGVDPARVPIPAAAADMGM